MRGSFILLLIVVLSCNKKLPETDTENEYPVELSLSQEIDRLNEMRLLWFSHRISSYLITQQVSCFCVYEYTQPKVFRVINNQLQTINGESFEENYPTEYLTILEAFDFIEVKLNEAPHEIRISYNSTYGFPESFYFDMDEMMADEEIDFTFSNFSVLEIN